MLLFYFICFLLLNFLSPLTLSSIACPAPFSILLTSPLLSLFLSSYPSYHHSLSVSSLHFSIFYLPLCFTSLLLYYHHLTSPHSSFSTSPFFSSPQLTPSLFLSPLHFFSSSFSFLLITSSHSTLSLS
jgi:hypothetical protein